MNPARDDASVQVIPSVEYIPTLVESLLAPPANHLVPFHATHFTDVSRIAVPDADAIQLIPSWEYAVVFVATPPATHMRPFHATEKHSPPVKTVVPDADAVQVIPS
jgi:hypothetical protein